MPKMHLPEFRNTLWIAKEVTAVMSLHIIENDCLRVSVADAGAELQSVYDKRKATERIWTGDPAVWNRHAPILFPFVGKVVDGKYRVGDAEYPMPTQHGFARDLAFECIEADAGAVVHRLASSDWTRERYPYDFALTVRHSLASNELRVEWTVENTGDGRMYYSIGGHPGFTLPEGVRKEDCFIRFPGKDALTYIGVNQDGYAMPERKTLRLEDGLARYQADIPDTWIFEDGQVQAVGIATPDGQPWVTLRCEQFPMLAVWAKGPFICLEPWFGRTDDEGFGGTIEQKKGMVDLEPGSRRDIAYSIDFC